jgi:hypothetical protein
MDTLLLLFLTLSPSASVLAPPPPARIISILHCLINKIKAKQAPVKLS